MITLIDRFEAALNPDPSLAVSLTGLRTRAISLLAVRSWNQSLVAYDSWIPSTIFRQDKSNQSGWSDPAASQLHRPPIGSPNIFCFKSCCKSVPGRTATPRIAPFWDQKICLGRSLIYMPASPQIDPKVRVIVGMNHKLFTFKLF